MPAIGPGDSQALVSPGHQHRSTEVRSRDCSSHAPGHTLGAMEAAQTLTWPNSQVYVPTKPTAAKARPVPAAGALVVLPDVSQVLNIGSHQRRCNSTVHVPTRRFQLLSLSHTAPGAQLGFLPHLCMCSSHWSLLQRLQEHMSLPGRKGPRWWFRWEGHPDGRCCGINWTVQAHQAAIRTGRSPRSGGLWRRWWQGCVSWWEPSLVPVEAGVGMWGKRLQWQPCLCLSLSNGALLLWRSGLPPQAFLVVELLNPVPTGCLLTANSSPLPRSALQTPRSSTQPLCAPTDTHLGLGHQGCGTDHLCRSQSVLPATDWLLHSPLSPQSSPSVLADLPASEGLPPSSPVPAPHHGLRSHPVSSPLPFPFFFLSSYPVTWGFFLSF